MDGQLLQITREELGKFTVDLEKTLGEKQNEKFDQFEKKLDKSFSDFQNSFSKPMSDQEKQDKANEIMGKSIFNLANMKKGRKYDKEFIQKALDPQDEGTAADGGYLTPTITAAEILRLQEEYGQGRQYFRNYPMGKAPVIRFPKKLTGATVTRVGENTAIPDTKVTLTYADLTASKVAAIVAITSELEEDAIVDIGAYVNEQLAESFAEEEDGQIWAGTGSPHTGAFNTSSTYGLNSLTVANSASIVYDDLVSCAMGLKSWYLRNAAWYMHRSVAADLMKIKDNNGLPILINAGDPMRATMFGYPVRLIESAPNSSTATSGMPLILLGDMNKAGIFGLKRDYTMTVLTEATVDGVNLAENDLIGIRVTKRDAFTLTQPLAISAIKIT
jgi:HK97 family phage major capsid protein